MQDRMKEWGKRYLQPCAEWFGYRFPDRILKVTMAWKLSSKHQQRSFLLVPSRQQSQVHVRYCFVQCLPSGPTHLSFLPCRLLAGMSPLCSFEHSQSVGGGPAQGGCRTVRGDDQGQGRH